MSTRLRCCLNANEAVRDDTDETNDKESGGATGNARSQWVRSAAALGYTFVCCLKTLIADCLQVRVCNAGKLMTKEDPFHVHKLLGMSCLLHFAYRILRLIRTGSTGLQQDKSTPVCLAFHAALSLSSFVFSLPAKRSKERPMIWPEFRLHSIIFAVRSIICALLLWWEPAFSPLLRGGVCLITMKLADMATERYKDSNNATSVRGVPYPVYIPEMMRQVHRLFYAWAQATGTMLMFCSYSPDIPFFALLVIQVTPFVSTLVRKSVVNGPAFHFYYTGLLFFSGWCDSFRWGATVYNSAAFSIIFMFMIFRVGLRMNKYIFWSCSIAYVIVDMQQPFLHSLRQAHVTWRSSQPTHEYVVSLAEQGDYVSLHALFGMHPDLVTARTRNNVTVLHYGVLHGYIGFIRRCLRSGLPVDGYPGSHTPTPLTLAVLRDNLHVVQVLLNRGANPDYVMRILRANASQYDKVSTSVLETLYRRIEGDNAKEL